MLFSKQIAAKVPFPEPRDAVTPVIVYGEYVTGATLPVNSIIEMVAIPAGTVVTSYKIVCDSLDSDGTPAITFTAGLMSGRVGDNDDTRTCGTSFVATNTAMQAGGVVSDSKPAPMLMSVSNSDKGVGITITTAADALVVGAKIRMYLTCVANPFV